MSDPTARRGDNIKRLLSEMKKTRRGWTENQIKNFLFGQYRYGVTEQTLDRIFNQLKDHGVIFGKQRRSPPFVLFYPMTDEESPSF